MHPAVLMRWIQALFGQPPLFLKMYVFMLLNTVFAAVSLVFVAEAPKLAEERRKPNEVRGGEAW